MMPPSFPPQQSLAQGRFSAEDLACIAPCRGDHNRLGFAYQLAFVRVFNRFPAQEPLEIKEDLLTFASIQLSIDLEHGEQYGSRQQTVSEHQESIRHYLGLQFFRSARCEVEAFLLKEACQLEQTAALTARLKEFLRARRILEPSQDTMLRLVQTQREAARTAIYDNVSGLLGDETRPYLDALLVTDNVAYSSLHYLKQPPGNPSPASFIRLTETLERIQETGVLAVDMTWLNNNFQRSLARYARQCSLYQLRRLKEERRYTALLCFLRQLYQDRVKPNKGTRTVTDGHFINEGL